MVIENFSERRSCSRIRHQHAREKVFAFYRESPIKPNPALTRRKKRLTRTEPDGILNQSPLDLCMQCRHALIVERNLATDQNIENDAKAPHVYLGSGVNLGVEEFRGGKIERAAKCTKVARGIVKIGEAEVD